MVRQGYKQTEVGEIPKDWCCAKLEDVATISMCKRIFADQTTENGEIPFYKIGTFGKEADSYISRALYNEYKNRFSFPQKGDVLISAAGTLGRTVVYDGKDAYFQDSNIVWLDIDKATLCNEYLNHYYRIIKWASSEGSTIARLYNGIIYATNIALPPIDEQKRIAQALSDVDSMISSFEKLIGKKKAVKQGAMQELLTGKKRLPGFTEKWQECTLGNLCYLITKQTGFDYTNEIKPSLVDINSNSTLPFIQNKDFEGKKVNVKTDYYIPYDIAIKYPRIFLDETCLLISLSGRIGNVGLYEKSNGLAFIGGAVGICRFKDEHNAEWCMLYLQSTAGQKQIFECQKSGAQHNLTVEDARKLVVKLPSTLEEQTAIASILSDMDNEIEALEQKLAKTRQLKQGMMQQLLTGKIRLV